MSVIVVSQSPTGEEENSGWRVVGSRKTGGGARSTVNGNGNNGGDRAAGSGGFGDRGGGFRDRGRGWRPLGFRRESAGRSRVFVRNVFTAEGVKQKNGFDKGGAEQSSGKENGRGPEFLTAGDGGDKNDGVGGRIEEGG